MLSKSAFVFYWSSSNFARLPGQWYSPEELHSEILKLRCDYPDPDSTCSLFLYSPASPSRVFEALSPNRRQVISQSKLAVVSEYGGMVVGIDGTPLSVRRLIVCKPDVFLTVDDCLDDCDDDESDEGLEKEFDRFVTTGDRRKWSHVHS